MKKPDHIRLIIAFQTQAKASVYENVLLCVSEVRMGGKRCWPSGEASLKNAQALSSGVMQE